jgi:hypothetical protein
MENDSRKSMQTELKWERGKGDITATTWDQFDILLFETYPETAFYSTRH